MRGPEKVPASPRNGPQRAAVDAISRGPTVPILRRVARFPESFPRQLFPSMNAPAPSAETISARAYQLWEQQGSPWGDGQDLERWLQAERELLPHASPMENAFTENEAIGAAAELVAPVLRSPEGSVPISNLDRELPPRERTKARAVRHGTPKRRKHEAAPEQLFVVLDRSHLRIYHEAAARKNGTPSWEVLEAFDLPSGRERFTSNEADQAGRFPGSHGLSPGGSIDERLPIQEEQQRRIVHELAEAIESFLREHPTAKWDLACEAELQHAILPLLPTDIRGRVRHQLPKILVNQPLAELRDHFARAT